MESLSPGLSANEILVNVAAHAAFVRHDRQHCRNYLGQWWPLLTTLDDGRVFPDYQGKPLCWSIGLYMTHNEAMDGYPKARLVIAAMRVYRPEVLERERRDMLKGSFDRMFGHNARACLALIDSTD